MKTFDQFINEEKIQPTHICIDDTDFPDWIKRDATTGRTIQLKGLLARIKPVRGTKEHPSDDWRDIVFVDEDDFDYPVADMYLFKNKVDSHFRELTPTEITSHKYKI